MAERCCFLFIRQGPYHRARLQAMANHVPTALVELNPDSSTYAWQAIKGRQTYELLSLPASQSGLSWSERLDRAFSAYKPTVLFVSGWAEPGAQGAILWGLTHGIPVIIMADSQAQDHQRHWMKERIKRMILSSCHAAFVSGSRTLDYLTTLGMPTRFISLGYDVIDNDHFARGAASAREHAPQTRASLGLPPHYFLTCARFVEEKNLPFLLQAYSAYRATLAGTAWPLVLVGDGPLRTTLTDMIDEMGLTDQVILPGFKQYDELPAYYGLASAFILPSRQEPWGLVVNEAMAAGIPVLVSQACGCVPELVHEDISGHSFAPTDVARLTALMIRLTQNDSDRIAMGTQAQQTITEWGLDRFVTGALQSVRIAQERGALPWRSLKALLLPYILRAIPHRATP